MGVRRIRGRESPPVQRADAHAARDRIPALRTRLHGRGGRGLERRCLGAVEAEGRARLASPAASGARG